MSKRPYLKKPAGESDTAPISRLAGYSSIFSGFIGILLSVLTAVLSFFVTTSKDPQSFYPPTGLVYLAGGIILLGIVIVGIGSLMRRQNRDVILLSQRLADIYVLALRKSALNPHAPSND